MKKSESRTSAVPWKFVLDLGKVHQIHFLEVGYMNIVELSKEHFNVSSLPEELKGFKILFGGHLPSDCRNFCAED